MDAKSLAKSKRSHSRNLNRKHHPNPKSNPHSYQSADAANPGAAKQKLPRRNSGAVPGLPSNWDRYEDEEQTVLGEGVSAGAGDRSVTGKVEASDIPVPKSKGADYRYLVEEAKSQRQYLIRGDSSCDAVFSVDDTIPGFFQEVESSLISMRGEAILAWCDDDKFAIEDESCPIPEVPFLSLNLNKLEEQLAKIDVAKRLFIDPDLLPTEWQSTSSSSRSNMVSDQTRMQETEATRRKVDELSLDELTEVEVDGKDAKRNGSSRWLPTSNTNQVDSNTSETYRSREAAVIADPPSQEGRGNPALFEEGAAEAELDALLDSFGEVMFVNPPPSVSSASYRPVPQQHRVPLPQTSSRGFSSSETMINDDVDSFLDDLLEETKNDLSIPKQANMAAMPPLQEKISKPNSAALNDLESWLDTI